MKELRVPGGRSAFLTRLTFDTDGAAHGSNGAGSGTQAVHGCPPVPASRFAWTPVWCQDVAAAED